MDKINKILKIIKIAPLISTIVLILFFVFSFKLIVFFTSEGKWVVLYNQIIQFECKDGSIAKNRFVKYLGKYYFVDENGNKVVLSWVDNNKKYLGANGQLAVSRYSNDSDELDNLYYFDKDGNLLDEGIHIINNNEIIVRKDHTIINTCFTYIPNTDNYVYVGKKGEIYKNRGIVDINGDNYIIDASGIIYKNQFYNYKSNTYYLNNKGAIVKNKWIDDTYYFDKDGKMLKDTTTPDGSYVNKEGKVQFINKIRHIFDNKNVGDIVKFGKYYINDDKNKEDIEWEIMKKDDNNAYLLSKYVLDVVPYEIDIDQKNEDELDWENSYLRNWLNNYFMLTILNMNDIQCLVKNKNINLGNEIYSLQNENDTYDNIFILSIDEYSDFFDYNLYSSDKTYGMANATPYAHNNGIYSKTNDNDEVSVHYWIRTKGSNEKKAICCVSGGIIDYNGYYKIDKKIGVRPCLIVNYTKKDDQ